MVRKAIRQKLQLKIWVRDNWTCRYCGEPVFFLPTLNLLDKLSPNHGYNHPHSKTGSVLSLFQWRWASVDHVVPVTKGGTNDEENLVTACWRCNLNWNNKSVAQGKPQPNKLNENAIKVSWDGLSSLYPKLCKKKDDWCRLIEAGVESSITYDDYLEGLKNLRKVW